MANIIFKLRNPKSKTPTPIYLTYNFGKDKLTYPMGFSVNPKHWGNKFTLINSCEEPRQHKINTFLRRVQADIGEQIANHQASKKAITKDNLRTIIDEYFNPDAQPDNKDITFKMFFDKYLQELTERYNGDNPDRITFGTLRKFHQLHNEIFGKREKGKRVVSGLVQKTKVDYNWENIDQQFYKDFVKHLAKKNQATNNIGKHIKSLRTLLNKATHRRYNKYQDYKEFKILSFKSEAVYLNETELKKIYDMDLSDNERMDKVRDFFLIGAWTAQRISDFKKILENGKIEETNGFKFIEIRQKKTKNSVQIPILPVVEEILEKYDYKLPDPISDQRFNDYSKELVKLAGIDKDVTLKESIAGEEFETTKPKYDWVSSHTCRRSFCTNMVIREYPTNLIMSISGHKSERQFWEYVKITPKEKAQAFAKLMAKDGMFMNVKKVVNS